MGYWVIPIPCNFDNLLPVAVHNNTASNGTNTAIRVGGSEFAFIHVWGMLMLVLLLKTSYSTAGIVKINSPAVNVELPLQ